MITLEFLLAWFLVMFPLVYSPGPANTLFASNGAQFGLKRSMPFLTGIDIAFVLQSLLVGFGLSGVLVSFPWLLTAFRYAGIAYIAYLGCIFLRAAMKPNTPQPHCLSFTDGLVVTALNPKAWMMQVMMFSQFFDAADAVVSIVNLTFLLAILNVSGHVVWILFGSLLLGRATHSFSQSRQNLIFAAMLFGSIGFLL
ncbi:MAG: LysE family translocator [Rickettsiales bacterium]|nr:LysE family translocator [Rickettsiales bacterium]